MKQYIIYRIPNYKWKNGKIGKIGCTDDLLRRMKAQYATEYEILETHSDIYIASQREIELQKQYGYPVDKTPYYKIAKMFDTEACSRGGKKNIERLKKYTSDKEHQSIAGKKGGLITGKKNVESGQIYIAQQKSVELWKKSIIQFDRNGNKIKEWDSATDAARGLGLQATHITRVLKGRRNHTGGFFFQYKH